MYWGFFVADAAYWKKVQTLTTADKDAPTRKFALRLLGSRTQRAK
jgi:hypothetical protein